MSTLIKLNYQHVNFCEDHTQLKVETLATKLDPQDPLGGGRSQLADSYLLNRNPVMTFYVRWRKSVQQGVMVNRLGQKRYPKLLHRHRFF